MAFGQNELLGQKNNALVLSKGQSISETNQKTNKIIF
jgi:hypothetical protein